MTAAVITGVSHHHEQQLVSLLESADGVEVVRRCADVAELLSTGASGVADVAVVSADFRGLDRDALRHLALAARQRVGFARRLARKAGQPFAQQRRRPRREADFAAERREHRLDERGYGPVAVDESYQPGFGAGDDAG